MQDLARREPKRREFRVERAKYSVKRINLRDAFTVVRHRSGITYDILQTPHHATGVEMEYRPFWSAGDFFSAKTIDQLIAEQGVSPIADISVFAGVIPDEDIDEFVADIYRDRLA
jgi:hypothetical protein